MTIRMTILASTALIALAGAAQAAEELHIINCGADTEGQAPVQAEHIKEWEAANAGYSVRVEFLPWEQCQEKALTLAAAGTPPAAAYMGSRVLKQLAAAEQILPFQMSDEEMATYEPSVIATAQFDGQVWGLPRAFSTKALYWNKDLFAQAGLDMPNGPTTFDELLTAARAITEKTGAKGFGMPAADMDNTFHEFLNFLYSNGGQVVDAEGKVAFDSPNNVETLKFYQELAKYAQPGPIAYDRGKLEPLFKEGQVAMYTSGAWGRTKAEGVNFGVAPIPAGPQGQHSTLLITDSLVVFKGTGKEEATTSLVKFLTAPDRQAAFDKAGGWTPIRQGEGAQALIAEDPNWKPFIEAVPAGGPEPLMQDYVAMQDAAIDGIQALIEGEITPEEAAKQIQDGLTALN
ncbi:extracellular solute-binding protein [Paracoccus sp. p3-h83]|uniref:extracellular solute-binding protein n=1 Tax=Paracoccus sp. p3-h83 TaxID=3342805 RepID=UPI0035BB23D5